MVALNQLDLRDARDAQKSTTTDLRALLRQARTGAGGDRLADRIAELRSCLEYVSRQLIAHRKASVMEPCMACGSPFLPEGMDWPRCVDCGAEHGSCPHCGNDVLAEDTCCVEGVAA